MEEIGEVRDAEEDNYQESRRFLGDSVTLLEHLTGLYKLMGEIIGRCAPGPTDEIVSAMQFLLGCRYQLTRGALCVLRGHPADSFYFTRKAIELCAFAARVKAHPHLAMVWLHAGRDEPSWQKYLDKFRPGKLLRRDERVLGELRARYGACCKVVHPSLYSMAWHLRAGRSDGQFTEKFSYFVPEGDARPALVSTFTFLVGTHFLIIRVFEQILGDLIVASGPTWGVRRNCVEAKLGVHEARWKDVAAGGGD